MKRVALIVVLMGASMPGRAADAAAPPSTTAASVPAPAPPAPTPQKVAAHVVAMFQSHRGAALKKESAQDIAILEKGAKDFPTDAHLLVALAYCDIVIDDKAAHLKNMEKAHEVAPKDAQIELSYAVALKMNKQPVKALEVMKALAAQFPKLVPVQFQLALMEIGVQEYDDAIAIIEPILKDPAASLVDVDKGYYTCTLADCYLYKGDRARAIDLAQQAVVLAPQLGTAYVVLGEAYLKEKRDKDIENANAALSKALAISPNSPRGLYYKGLVLELGKEDGTASYNAAYTNLKQLVGANGENGEDYYLMSMVCGKLGKKEEAATYKAEAAKLGFTFEAPWKK